MFPASEHLRARSLKYSEVVILYVNVGDQGILQNPGMRNVAISRHSEKLYIVSDGTEFCDSAALQMSEPIREEFPEHVQTYIHRDPHIVARLPEITTDVPAEKPEHPGKDALLVAIL